MSRRILLLITDLEIGGTPTVVRELAIRLNQPGVFDVQVVCLSQWGPVANQLTAAKIKVTALGAAGIRSLPVTLVRLIRLIRSERIGIVFSFLLHANFTATLATMLVPAVRLVQSIQTTQPNPRWHWHLQRLISSMADLIVVPSRSVAESAERWSNVAADWVRVIPNAVDVDSFASIAPPAMSRKPIRVGFIGRLDPIKRVEDLLESVRHWASGEVDVHVYGNGPERPRLELLAMQEGIRGHVTFHGSITRPHEALAMIDVLVLPSDAEGFGLVLIEAMAAHVPVVATNVPGIRNVVKDLQTGILVPPRTSQAICGAIMTLYIDPALRRRLVTAAAKDVRERFGWDRVLCLYRRLLN